jgi:L-asparaginase
MLEKGVVMKWSYKISTLLLALMVGVGYQNAFGQAKPNIVILATGGTIAGAAATGTQSGYTSGQVTIDAMINSVPGIRDLANLKGEQVANVGSQDMSFDIMLKLARRINELLASPDVDGVVVTHGTDTMEETAYFLNLTVKSDKPVVLVGSMRPSTAVSADGPLNLYNAVGVAADPKARGRGVLVVMNDQIQAAHSLTKTSTTAVETFQSPLRGVVGVTAYGKNDFYNNPPWRHTTASQFDVSNVIMIPRVDIIYADADMPPDLIEDSVKNGARGIVIAGVGNGNMNKASVDAAARAVQEGVVVVRASRVPTGTVGRNVEIKDDQLGFIASDELNPQKARILLSLALLKPHTPQQIQEMFYSY